MVIIVASGSYAFYRMWTFRVDVSCVDQTTLEKFDSFLRRSKCSYELSFISLPLSCKANAEITSDHDH